MKLFCTIVDKLVTFGNDSRFFAWPLISLKCLSKAFMKIVAFIPIKLNSKRLPFKNIKQLASGKPLMHYIQNTIKGIDDINECYIYCSDRSVEQYILPGISFLQRSPLLDLDTANATDLVSSFIDLIPADVYIMVHATSPFTKASTICDGIEKVKSGDFDSAYPVERVQKFAWFKGKPLNYSPDFVPRTQDVEPVYVESANPFIFTRQSFLSTRSRIGARPYMLHLGWQELIDVDTHDDFDKVNTLLPLLLE